MRLGHISTYGIKRLVLEEIPEPLDFTNLIYVLQYRDKKKTNTRKFNVNRTLDILKLDICGSFLIVA